MADTYYPVNHPMAVKLWRRRLAMEALKSTSFSDYVGEDENSLIHIKTETQKSPGDKITFGLQRQLKGRGARGNETLEGNEEKVTVDDDAVVIDKLRHAVRVGSSTSIDQQRVPFDTRQTALRGLVDWHANRMDTGLFNQLCGWTLETDDIYTGLQPVEAPDTEHRLWADAAVTDDAALAPADVMDVNIVNRCRERATTLETPIRPISMGGSDWYVMFLHPYQVTDLRQSAQQAGSWFDIQQAAIQGGEITQNPIFTGALGVVNKTILIENTRITKGISEAQAEVPEVRRAVFCGAQAAACAFGQGGGPDQYDWFEELFDYGNRLGVEAGSICGIKKTRYASKDYGVLTVSTYGVAH